MIWVALIAVFFGLALLPSTHAGAIFNSGADGCADIEFSSLSLFEHGIVTDSERHAEK
jgi:hypothetical protein